MDATEIRVRRPARKHARCKRFIFDKSHRHAVKAQILCNARGRVLSGGTGCPDGTADITQARQAGVAGWPDHTTVVEILPTPARARPQSQRVRVARSIMAW
jgi:hypothetical protein